MQIYSAAEDPACRPRRVGPAIGGKTGVEPRDAVPVDPPGKAQYYLLWITSSPSPPTTTSRFRVEISDVKVIS